MPFSFRALTPGSGEIIVERPGEALKGPVIKNMNSLFKIVGTKGVEAPKGPVIKT